MLQINLIMIFIIHKILELLKITRIIKRFLTSLMDFYLKKKLFFFTIYHGEKFKA